MSFVAQWPVDVPAAEIEPAVPESAGEFLSPGPPGKSSVSLVDQAVVHPAEFGQIAAVRELILTVSVLRFCVHRVTCRIPHHALPRP